MAHFSGRVKSEGGSSSQIVDTGPSVQVNVKGEGKGERLRATGEGGSPERPNYECMIEGSH